MANLECIGKSLTTKLYNAFRNIYKQLVDEKFKIRRKSFAFLHRSPIRFSFASPIPPQYFNQFNVNEAFFPRWWWSFWPSMDALYWSGKQYFPFPIFQRLCLTMCKDFNKKMPSNKFDKAKCTHSILSAHSIHFRDIYYWYSLKECALQTLQIICKKNVHFSLEVERERESKQWVTMYVVIGVKNHFEQFQGFLGEWTVVLACNAATMRTIGVIWAALIYPSTCTRFH